LNDFEILKNGIFQNFSKFFKIALSNGARVEVITSWKTLKSQNFKENGKAREYKTFFRKSGNFMDGSYDG